MKLYRGYFGLEGKNPLQKWAREKVPDEALLTLEKASMFDDYGAPLTEETVLIDIDDKAQSEKLFEIIKAEGLKCKVIDTDRGKHFLFANRTKSQKKCQAHVRFAVGLSGDVKVGLANSYEKLKSHGKVRPCIYGESYTDTEELDEAPGWLKIVGKEDKTADFPNMTAGDGRNNEIYNHSYGLQKRGMPKDLILKTCQLLNNFVLAEPLEENELETVLRPESMNVPPTFDDDGRSDIAETIAYSPKGTVLPSIENAVALIRMEVKLDGVRRNAMADTIEAEGALPWKRPDRSAEWNDTDDAQLRRYLEKWVALPMEKVRAALDIVASERSYHPVKEYLESLPEWDGIKRAENLFIEYLGADDCEYTRQVTVKTLVAAIKRIYEPGCKFDTMLVLNGRQGLGKSTIIARLGGKWFSDSLKLSDLGSKASEEKIQGVWIEEIGELAGLKKIDIETLRSFITRQDDYGRAAYGRRATHKPRQCVFFGTTNAQDEGFLRDLDGNRRFWVVDVSEGNSSPFDVKDAEISQIWAEAYERYLAGEKLYLEGEVAEEATRRQQASLEDDPRIGIVKEYLEKKLPEGWYEKSIDERLRYLKYPDDGDSPGVMQRKVVSAAEIWVEALGGSIKDAKKESFAVRAIMQHIEGWKRSQNDRARLGEYGRQRVYRRKG